MFSKLLGNDPESEPFSSEFNKILVPDIYLIFKDFINGFFKRIYQISGEDKWEDKINKIFWRGASSAPGNWLSGDFIDNAYSKVYPRLGLIIESILKPHIIDAKISFVDLRVPYVLDRVIQYIDSLIGQCLYDTEQIFSEEETPENMYAMNLVYQRFTPEIRSVDDHIKYKYLISVDGNTASWGIVPWILQSKSLLLSQTEIRYCSIFLWRIN